MASNTVAICSKSMMVTFNRPLAFCLMILLLLTWWHHDQPNKCFDHRGESNTLRETSSESGAVGLHRLMNLTDRSRALTGFALPLHVWLAPLTVTGPLSLAVYRHPGDRWEDFSKSIVETGSWEKMETEVFMACVKECNSGGVVVDVGGFLGYYAVLAAHMGCRVHVWEGHPTNAAMITLSVGMNGLWDLVTVHNNVCTDEAHPLVFTGHAMDGHVQGSYEKSDNDAFKNILREEGRYHNEEGVVVQPLRVDDVIHDEVLLMKVDVEGYEPHVFRSARGLVNARKVRYILMEYNMWRAMTMEQGVELLNWFVNLGYSVYQVATPSCNYRQLSTEEEFLSMSWALRNGTYPCSSWNTDLLVVRDGLSTALMKAMRGTST